VPLCLLVDGLLSPETSWKVAAGIEGTSRETDMYEIDLPKEYVVDDVPEVVGSKLRYSREFVQRNVLIPPDRTEDLRKLEGIIGADEVAAVVLKRAQ
jgi:hypothetical protein